MDIALQARNADIEDVIGLLQEQQDVKYDVVVPSTHLAYDHGHLVVNEGAAEVTDDGVSLVDAVLKPTALFEDGIASKLEIPRGYLRRMRDHTDEDGDPTSLGLLDGNVNHWLEQEPRNLFVRGFRTDSPDEVGIARALLSDSYSVIDHIDAVMATLDGIRAAGLTDVQITSADLSEKNLRVKLTSPTIRAAAPEFLRDYRSPGSGEQGRDNPYLQGGLMIRNSETGSGAFQIAPFITVLVCKNGMTRTKEALRKVHLGARMETGAVRWSEDTKRHNVTLIRSQAKDAVQSFLSQNYIEDVAAELDGKAQTILERPAEAVENVCKSMRFNESEQAAILDYFIRGGDTRAVGVMQAVTAYAQEVKDPDRAAELEDSAFDVLDRVLASARAS